MILRFLSCSMREFMRSCSLLFVVFACSCASAQLLTGDELLKQCSAQEGSADWVRCEGFVHGVARGVTILSIALYQARRDREDYPLLFCIDKSVPPKKLIVIAVDYLRSHPDDRHYDAASELLLAFREAFPCPSS